MLGIYEDTIFGTVMVFPHVVKPFIEVLNINSSNLKLTADLARVQLREWVLVCVKLFNVVLQMFLSAVSTLTLRGC